MATSFFGGAFFDGEFFGAGSATVTKTGTGGIDSPTIFKPTGLLDRKINRRVQETHEIAQEVIQEAKERYEEPTTFHKPIRQMSLLEIDFEIGYLLRKTVRTEEDDLLLLILMAASA